MELRKTFESMGLRVAKSVASHLLLENAYDSNLLPDISKVDYLEGNLGPTHLRPLAGLPAFVDDVYVFGYLRREDCVFQKGRLSCTTGEEGSAKAVVGKIGIAVQESLGTDPNGGKRSYMQTSIVHTISEKAKTGSTICATIQNIENRTNAKARKKWEEIYGAGSIVGFFVAKVDVSEIPIDELQSSLPAFERQLSANGYGIYSIDYTQDFSGVLERKVLVQYLRSEGFHLQGDFVSALEAENPTILENTKSVGEHVCTWIDRNETGNTVRTKTYNKIVSNMEAGEVRESVGGHLADYVDCPNKHLRETFLHPDVQKRGCTRIEVSLYACTEDDLCTQKANEEIQSALSRVSPGGGQNESEGLFVVQPSAKQWENLAKSLDRCLVLADKCQGQIFAGWYAHTGTGRISGVHVRPTKTTVEDDGRWEKAVEWAAGDFGFRACPIFRLDILAADEEGVVLGPLRCYTKDANARTILAASKKPTQLHPNGPEPSLLLPTTKTVSWVWRTEKCQTVGRGVSSYELLEVPEIAKNREVSALSTRNREKRLQEIQDAQNAEEWRRKCLEMEEAQRKDNEEKEKNREEELARLENIVEARKRYEEKSRETEKEVDECLRGNTRKVAELAKNQKWRVLGYRRTERQYNSRVVLRGTKADTVAVWATKGLETILAKCEKCFESKADKYRRETFWLPPIGEENPTVLEIGIEPSSYFETSDGKKAALNLIRVFSSPDPQNLEELRSIAQECEKIPILRVAKQQQQLLQAPAPKNKDTKKALDLPPGEYTCRRYSTKLYRGSPRTILFLLPIGEDGEPTTDLEIPTYGCFLEKELAALGGTEALQKRDTPFLCRIGQERTTPQKKKDRLVALAL